MASTISSALKAQNAIGSAHAAVKRARLAGLLAPDNAPIRANLLEFFTHRIRYEFYTECGSIMRGVPTGGGSPGISDFLGSTVEKFNVTAVGQG
jgi:hypothetical protein